MAFRPLESPAADNGFRCSLLSKNLVAPTSLIPPDPMWLRNQKFLSNTSGFLGAVRLEKAFASKSEFHQIPQRLESVYPIDLLSLIVSTAIVADSDFIYSPTPFPGYLGTYLNLDTKAICGE